MLRRSRSEAPSACPLPRRVTRAEETPDQFQLRFAGDVVGLDELTPFDMEAGRFEDVDLLAHDGKRDHGIQRAVGDQQTLLESYRREFLDQLFGRAI